MQRQYLRTGYSRIGRKISSEESSSGWVGTIIVWNGEWNSYTGEVNGWTGV